MWRPAVRRTGHFHRARDRACGGGAVTVRCIMAKVILKDIKKVYPNTEKKKKAKKGEEEKKDNLQSRDAGVVPVQECNR